MSPSLKPHLIGARYLICCSSYGAEYVVNVQLRAWSEKLADPRSTLRSRTNP